MAGEMDAALDALVAKLTTALPGRRVSRNFQPLSMRSSAELQAGVVTVMLGGERDLKRNLAATAFMGWRRVLVLGQLEVPNGEGGAVEAAEIALRDALLPALVVAPFPAGTQAVRDPEVSYSGQLEAPYGWVAIELEYF